MASNKNFRRNKAVFSTEKIEEESRRASAKQRGSKKAHLSRIERYSSIVANLAQVLMLGAIVWGYFYTVVPVFQKEKLTEDVARLKIEQSDWKKEIESYSENIRRAQKKLALLQSERNQLESTLNRIRLEKEKADNSLEKLANREQNSRKKLKSTADTLAEAERQLYEQLKLRLLGKNPLSMEGMLLINKVYKDIDIFESRSVDEVEDKLRSDFVQPVDFVDEKLERLKQRAASVSSQVYRNVHLKLIEEFKAGMQKNASSLQCPEPNFRSWGSEFGRALALGDEMIEDCVEFHFETRANKEGWSQRELYSLKGSKFWNEQKRIYYKICSSSIEYEVGKLYHERWDYIKEPCEDRLRRMSSVALEPGSTLRLMALRDTSPPSMSYIKSKVKASFDSWYHPED